MAYNFPLNGRRHGVARKKLPNDSFLFSESGITTNNPAYIETLEFARDIARRNSSVLITGETGTGKELMARYIYEHSPRKGKPYVPFNCAAIPDNLLESELFGHKKGSFTGAIEDKRGLIEEADGGRKGENWRSQRRRRSSRT